MIKINKLAKEIGVHPRTLERNYMVGKIPEPEFDVKGWRYYNQPEADMIRNYFKNWVPVIKNTDR